MEYDRKELVDWVRGIYQNLDEADKQDALRFFPELRESEEERIRKWIISQMQRLYDEANVGGSWEDFKMTEAAIFYLNKQKESEWSPSGGEMSVLYKLCYISNQITDEDDTELTRLYQDLKREYFNGRSFENMFLIEDQKEQKPAEKQDYSGLNDLERTIHRGFLSAGVKNVSVTIIKETARECLAQMNSAEWSEDDERIIKDAIYALEEVGGYHYTVKGLKSLSPQPHKEIYQAAKRDLAIKFMNYLDENRPEGKMSLSNGECKDIDKAFKENDWAKIMRYYEKYQPHWKPSEDEERLINTAISFLKDFADKGYENAVECIDWLKSKLNGNFGK